MPALRLRSVDKVAASRLEPRENIRRESQVIAVIPVEERRALAKNAFETGEALLARGLLEQAGERFQAAARAFDELGDAAGGAQALLGLGRVLLGLEDPVCREVLEDAGTWLEDLGDEAAVREVDNLLRIAERSIDESPRSFHAIKIHDVPQNGAVRGSSAPPPSVDERKV
ncbi:MAG: hypothetical protein JWO86_4252 [Myxococcaceae bacterium]|nr:hypothetical protein [Myxococcaceae bacterium]